MNQAKTATEGPEALIWVLLVLAFIFIGCKAQDPVLDFQTSAKANVVEQIHSIRIHRSEGVTILMIEADTASLSLDSIQIQVKGVQPSKKRKKGNP